MYKIYIYDILNHKEADVLTVSSQSELYKLKQVNYSFDIDDHGPVLVTMSKQFDEKEIIMRSFLCYNPSKNFYRKVYNVFAMHAVDLYFSKIFN